eukprot:7601162-Pyramimonas_sp.AAC.1
MASQASLRNDDSQHIDTFRQAPQGTGPQRIGQEAQLIVIFHFEISDIEGHGAQSQRGDH